MDSNNCKVLLLESYKTTLSTALSVYLRDIQCQAPWWYGVDIEPTDPSSLCQLLQIDAADYSTFLQSQGFTTHRGISCNRVESFVHDNKGIQWSRVKKRYFLRIGVKHPAINSCTPKAQFDLAKGGPPRIKRKALEAFQQA